MNIFLIIPYKSEFEDIYEAVKIAASFAGHKVQRAEDFSQEKRIQVMVRDAIKKADIVVAEISTFGDSKLSKNVGSEFFMAEESGKPIIPICTKGTDIPINLSKYQVILYDRLRLQDSLVKPLSNFLQKNDIVDFVLRKSKEEKPNKITKSIFVSYSHVDSIYLERLRIHLRPFEKKGQIDLWEDTKIKAGEKWKEKINAALDKSIIAILLVSADFLASDFIVDNELPPLLKSAEDKGKVILPLIVKPCRFTGDENLSKFQAINDPKSPLSKLSENDREEIYVKVADLIGNLVK